MPEQTQDDLLMQDHDYDGIQELDNDLPPWWLYMFYLSIVFGIGYMAYYHILGKGLSQTAAYAAEVQTAIDKRTEALAGQDPYAVGESTPELVSQGQNLFVANCSACHALDGGGLVGPNLTDDAWIHGCSDEEIVNVIRKGVPAKGMIAWESVLRPAEIVSLTHFIRSIRGSTPSAPKPAEGVVCE